MLLSFCLRIPLAETGATSLPWQCAIVWRRALLSVLFIKGAGSACLLLFIPSFGFWVLCVLLWQFLLLFHPP